ncbi:MAG: hypothetical protein ACOYJE_08300 [Bacteroidaceae bacterium]
MRPSVKPLLFALWAGGVFLGLLAAFPEYERLMRRWGRKPLFLYNYAAETEYLRAELRRLLCEMEQPPAVRFPG